MMTATCWECNSTYDIQFHHVVPKSLGGTKTLPLCAKCHGKVHGTNKIGCSELTKRGLQHLKAEGVTLGGEALGWTRTEETDTEGRRIVCKVESEALAVARILELRTEGRTLWAIADTLTAEGHKTKRGGRWHPQTVANVLTREAA